MRSTTCATFLALLFGLTGSSVAIEVGDNFASNPLDSGSPWSFGVGSNTNSQFSYSSAGLGVHIDTRLPTARFDLPLGLTLDDTSNFTFSARFSFHVTTASPDQFAQFAFGLTNQATTLGDRTGSPANPNGYNTYNTVELDYFPNVSTLFGGPTLSQAVFGGNPGGNATNNFSGNFDSSTVLSNHAPGVTALPQDMLLEAQLAYEAAGRTITLSMYQVGAGDVLTLLDTGVTPLDIDDPPWNGNYDIFNPFVVDTLSIMAYQDGYTSTNDPSVLADVTYRGIHLTIVPEPSSYLLALAGTGIVALARRRMSGAVTPA
jgi:hypothetical protein